MKVGDLVQCNFQPRCGGYDRKKKCLKTMVHAIKGELGIIIAIDQHERRSVMFPQFGYVHTLAPSTLEVIDENV